MVANFRCNELKEEALLNIKEDLHTLRVDCEKKTQPDFLDRCKGIMTSAIKHYDEFAHQYDKEVFEKVRKDLLAQVL